MDVVANKELSARSGNRTADVRKYSFTGSRQGSVIHIGDVEHKGPRAFALLLPLDVKLLNNL